MWSSQSLIKYNLHNAVSCASCYNYSTRKLLALWVYIHSGLSYRCNPNGSVYCVRVRITNCSRCTVHTSKCLILFSAVHFVGWKYGMRFMSSTQTPHYFMLADSKRLKVKGHLWVLLHLCLEGVLYFYPNEFLHSSPEVWETSASEGRNYVWNLASNPVIHINY
jgi:hypothetical protein